MKRDLDLVRKILLTIEAHEGGPLPVDFAHVYEGYNDDEIGYNSQLAIEAGLCIGFDRTDVRDAKPRAIVIRLTWAGHEFLDAARDQTRWKKVTSAIVDRATSVTFTVLLQLLQKYALQQTGLMSEP